MNDERDAPQLDQPPAKKQKVDNNETDQNLEEKTIEKDKPAVNNTASDDKYNNFVTPEEVEKLKEFRVLDEVKSNDEDSNEECDDSESSTGESCDVPEEEIEKMLEEDLPDGFKAAPKPKEKAYVTREKVILEEKAVNHFEVLPLDWIMIRHQSGMPVYVHRATRVCTLSKPYFLGMGNAKRHDIPISAIPCLAYRRALEEEEKQKLIDEKIKEQIKLGTWKTNAENLNNTNAANANPNEKITPNQLGADKVDQNANESKETNEPDNTVSTESVPIQVCPFRKPETVAAKGNSTDIEKTASNEQRDDTLNVNGSELEKEQSISNTDKEVVSNEANDKENQDNNKPSADGTDASTNDAPTIGTADEANKTVTPAGKVDIEIPLNQQPIVLPGGVVMPSPRVETVNTSWKTQHLTHDQVTEYCKKLFKFRVLNIMHFRSWADRRKYTKARKALQYPMLPEGTKLITIPMQTTPGQENSAGKAAKRDWVMNMNGRSYLSVFHEYVRRALQKQPVYEFKQLENASTPYQATVYIGGMQYGVGHGSSKRQAKSAAARASIHILIPEMRDHKEPSGDAEPDFVFFDYVGIEDPRIAEFCAATCEPTPHAILRTCLLRNFGAGDRHINTEMKKLEYQKIELTMKVGKHSATVVCKNKKTAKQRASQAILQALHPHVRSWGSLLRLYGSRSVKSCKERKLEEQQITLLQDQARRHEPNYAVLDKLRDEMRKLRERDAAVAPVGTLMLAGDLPTHSGSNLNNVEL